MKFDEDGTVDLSPEHRAYLEGRAADSTSWFGLNPARKPAADALAVISRLQNDVRAFRISYEDTRALLDKYEVACAARDSWEREYARLKAEAGILRPENDQLTARVRVLEQELSELRGRHDELKSELGKLAESY